MRLYLPGTAQAKQRRRLRPQPLLDGLRSSRSSWWQLGSAAGHLSSSCSSETCC